MSSTFSSTLLYELGEERHFALSVGLRISNLASGILVMACYNWGETQVLPLVRSMPANPRERNFWRLLGHHRDQIPKETYAYVFYIFSAAVIGENPRLFGFDFDNPLYGK